MPCSTADNLLPVHRCACLAMESVSTYQPMHRPVADALGQIHPGASIPSAQPGDAVDLNSISSVAAT